jgi:hypothetical protein
MRLTEKSYCQNKNNKKQRIQVPKVKPPKRELCFQRSKYGGVGVKQKFFYAISECLRKKFRN